MAGIRRPEGRNFLECGRDSYRFSSGTQSLPVLVGRRNKFRLRKAEAARFSTPNANFAIRKKLNFEYQ
jgi:hypothetical protein